MKLLKSLAPGDLIAIVSPAYWSDEATLASAHEKLSALGYRVRISQQSFQRNGPFAGSDYARAQAINDAFSDPDVSMVLCARGGYGTMRIVDFLSEQIISQNPKIFVGYSDLTPLLNYFSVAYGFPTFHGPMALDFCDGMGDIHLDSMIKIFSGESKIIADYNITPDKAINVGSTVAPIIGGNLTNLCDCIATPYDIRPIKSVLLIEDVSEPLYKIDRYLNHLRRVGYFSNISGVIVGEFTDTEGASRPFGKTELELLSEYFGSLDQNNPVVMGAPFGHMKGKLCLPIGVPLSIEVTVERVVITMSGEFLT